MGVFDTASKKIHNLLGMTTLGQKTKANSLGVTLASDQDALPVTDNASSLTVDSTQLPSTLGQKTKANSVSVTVASDQGALAGSVADGSNVVEGATADAAVITDAAGTLSGKLRGLVKWAFERMPASLGQKTMAASLPVVLASDQTQVTIGLPNSQSVLSVGGYLSVNKFSFADVNASTTPYVAGDLIGGKLTIGDGTPASDTSGRLKNIVVVDKANAKPELFIIFFDSDPTSTTFTDSATLSIPAADQPKVVGLVKIATADWFDVTPDMACKQVDLPMKAVGTRNLYAAIVSVGSYSPGVLQAISLTLSFDYDSGG